MVVAIGAGLLLLGVGLLWLAKKRGWALWDKCVRCAGWCMFWKRRPREEEYMVSPAGGYLHKLNCKSGVLFSSIRITN